MNNIEKLPAKRLSAALEAGDSLDAHRESALAVRTLEQALAAPTINMLALHHTPGEVGVAIHAMLTGAMEYFAPQRRMNSTQIGLFAEDMLDTFKHESLSDIALFMRNCALSKYDEGEFYGNVDVPRLKKWWTKYLEEKADAREQQANREEHLIDQRANDFVRSSPVLMAAVKSIGALHREQRIEQGMIRRITDLKENLPRFTDQELMDAFKLNTTIYQRSIIQAEIARRGLLGEELQKAQIQYDAQQAAAKEEALKLAGLDTKEDKSQPAA